MIAWQPSVAPIGPHRGPPTLGECCACEYVPPLAELVGGRSTRCDGLGPHRAIGFPSHPRRPIGGASRWRQLGGVSWAVPSRRVAPTHGPVAEQLSSSRPGWDCRQTSPTPQWIAQIREVASVTARCNPAGRKPLRSAPLCGYSPRRAAAAQRCGAA
eukprot:scaffold5014_cov387-Prasinococcus_capsulatus_cf.AAC.16